MTSMFEDWLASLRQDPNRAVSDLFTGRAAVASTSRLGIPQILRQLFPAQRVEDQQKLDEALLVWLLRMREEQAVQVEQLGKSAFAYQLVEALSVILLMDLPHCREHIRAHLEAWLQWLTLLRVSPDRDPSQIANKPISAYELHVLGADFTLAGFSILCFRSKRFGLLLTCISHPSCIARLNHLFAWL